MSKIYYIKGERGNLFTIDNYVDPVKYKKMVEKLLLIERPTILIMGKECRQNRSVGLFSNHIDSYFYSGKEFEAQSASK